MLCVCGLAYSLMHSSRIACAKALGLQAGWSAESRGEIERGKRLERTMAMQWGRAMYT